jgi:hypothetical protein
MRTGIRNKLITRNTLIALALVFMVSAWGTYPSAAFFQKSKDEKKSKKSKNKIPANAPTAAGTPALWTDRGNTSSLDLFWGIGSEDKAPKPPFQFDKEDVSGTNPKIKVIDGNGVKWNVKFDEEVHAEVACSRLVWAAGYLVEESYFLASAKVNGVTGLKRARKFVGADGSISNAMFEKRPDNIARRNILWGWDSNPFSGTKELSGLIIMAVMLNNWDAKVDNNNVLGMFDEDGTTVKDWYIVADWGGTLGKMGNFISHSKWDPDAFTKQAFLDGVSGGSLKLHYTGKGGSAMKQVPLEHARWFAGIVGQLTDAQINDAFRAAGAAETEKSAFAARIRQKINELKSAVGSR